jgi:membrane protease subunit HflK
MKLTNNVLLKTGETLQKIKNRMLWRLADLLRAEPRNTFSPQLAESAPPSDPQDGKSTGQSASSGTNPSNVNPTPQAQSPAPKNPHSEDGPPDLDELWSDFNKRLGNLFGNKKPNSPNSTNTPPSNNSGASSNQPGNNPQGPTSPPPRSPMSNSSNNSSNNSPNKGFTELIQDWLKKNSSGGGGNLGGSGKGGGSAIPNIGFGIVLIGILVVWLFSGIFIVQEGQAGVVLQFGKYKYTTRPGINWRLPYPIQAHEVVNVSNVRSVEIGKSFVIQATNLKDSSMLTEDENIIDVKFAVQYRLKEPTEYLFTNREPDAAVIQAAETAVREIVGRSKMDDVLYVGRERIGVDLATSIQKILDSYKTGIYITSVNVQNVQPPEQVQSSFDDAVKAGQDQERQKNEGQAYANDIVPRAKGTAARLLEEAEGYRAKVIAMAEGDASRFKQIYVEYAKAPQVTRDRMYIDTMQQIYSNVTKVLVDTKSGNQLLYLPLDKLIQQATPNSDNNVPLGSNALPSSNSAQPPSGSVTVPLTPMAPSLNGLNSTPSPSPMPSDKRDSLRSRDRDIR